MASAALVAALPRLCADPEIRQYAFPMRWVWPDAGHWLDELPWSPDFHNAPGAQRRRPVVRGPHPHRRARAGALRFVEPPAYHLDLVLTSEAERAAKVARYVAARPGLVAPGGGELNAPLLPARSAHARLDPAPVPPEDRERIAAVLDAPTRVPGPAAARASRCSGCARIFEAAHGRARCLEPDAYQASIRPLERDHRMLAGETRNVYVGRPQPRDRRRGRAGECRPPEIRLSYHWRDADGAMLIHDGHRTPFPAAVVAGRRSASCRPW